MKRRALTSVLTAAAVALALPVYAQDKGQSGARPNPSGGSSGSAVSRPSGGGGSSSGGGSSASTPSSGGGSSVSRPSPRGSSPRGEFRAPRAPQRRTGGTAVPRASNRSDGSNGDTRRVSPVAGSSASASDNSGDRRRAVPAYSRPRDGRPTTGSAVGRTGLPPLRDGGYYYDPFYRYSFFSNRYPYGYYYPSYGFGLGYFYDPWMWGYASPYSYGGGGGYYSGSYYGRSNRDIGAIRLKLKPEHGQVYVDGYYVGEVDSFDGMFQKLNLESGAHRIEIRAEGYETEQFEVMVIPGETITYKGDLKRMQ